MLKCTLSQGVIVANNVSRFLIGELGRRTGLATSALRYYEQVGLLAPDGRVNRRRYYGPASTERIALIRLCQDAGFTLGETRAFIAAGGRRNRSWRRLMEGKLLELAATIARAKRAKSLIEHALACKHRELSSCPNFRAALQMRLLAPHFARAPRKALLQPIE